MALVVKRKAGAVTLKEKEIKIPKVQLSLPSKLSEPSEELGEYSILLYGEKKIGKTSLSSQCDKAFFMMCEPGAKALSIYQRPVKSWEEFKGYVALLEKDGEFRTVVVDPIDIAYKLCVAYVCKKLGIEHLSEEDWGKGWEACRDEFTSEITKLLSLDKGIILISHAAEKEIKTRTGDKYHKISPTMSGQAREVLEGIVDIWAYYCYDGSKRTLIIEGDDHIGAGHRLEKKFKYTDGAPIREIPMGKSPKEAFENFMKAFNNQLRKEGSAVKSSGLKLKNKK